MPIYMDRHEMKGLTASAVAQTHLKDLAIQDRYGVRFLTYWFDEARGTAFCLIESPDMETAVRLHREAHGGIPVDVIAVQASAVEAFLGRVSDPVQPDHRPAAIDGAFRSILFTDIVDSVGLTARIGDVRAVELVRAHDGIVRRAIAANGGRVVKHTGDGIMASFAEAAGAAASACAIQAEFAAFNRNGGEPLRVRIGVHAGEPVEDSDDLFGATVQIAARICQEAEPEAIVVSETVRDLLPASFRLVALGPRRLKGVPAPTPLYAIEWR